MHHSSRRFAFICLLAFLLAFTSVGCANEPEPKETAMVVSKGEPTQEATVVSQEEPPQKATPTAFRVEIPVTATPSATPTQVDEKGTPLPTDTPAPTNTPRPTKTPWPTRAPTSAPADDPDMAYVPGGEFVFGNDGGKEDESPQQTVQMDGFNIDIHPVTCAEYRKFVEATGHRAPRNWKEGQLPAGQENNPVVWVSWEDATAYAKWAGKRLPTETEWEKAARGSDGRQYPWGDTFDSSRCNSREANLKKTSPVDQFPNGASPYGTLDMAGNVWEWTADWYDAYRGSLYKLDRFGTTYKVLRGGSWFDGADAVRTTTRNSAKPSFSFSTIGFRCAK